MSPPSVSPEQLKAELRRQAHARRDALPAAERAAAARAIATRPFPLAVPAGAIVSGFVPIKSEINPLPLMRKLAEAGAKLALPVVAGRGKPLIMRAWRFGERLHAGGWGIQQPAADAEEVRPDILIVPLLAFDRRGWRLGYGGGFYDRTLKGLRARRAVVAIGLAHDQQEVDAVPHLDYDQRLDWVLTPSGPIRCTD
jgi:5-formyltetrahydrofolate cyclo-ligase